MLQGILTAGGSGWDPSSTLGIYPFPPTEGLEKARCDDKMLQPGKLQVKSEGKSCATLHIHHAHSILPCQSCRSGGQISFVLWQEAAAGQAAASSQHPSLRHSPGYNWQQGLAKHAWP